MYCFPQRIISFRPRAARPSRRRDRLVGSFEQLEQRHALTAGINDAPQGGDAVFVINEDTTYSFTTVSFGFADPIDAAEGAAHSMSAVLITGLPVAGALSLNGSPVTAGQRIPVASLSTGSGLVFTPAANAFGSPYASIAFRVQDNGGTVSGGIDTDPTPNTITISVIPVNDAPTITPISGPTYITPTDTTAIARGQIHAADIDPGTTLTYGLESPTVDNGVIASQVGKYGTLYVVKATGAYEFHPRSAAINAIPADTTEAFMVQATDGSASASTALTIMLRAANRAPELFRRDSTAPLPAGATSVTSIAAMGDGKLLAACDRNGDLVLCRYNADGTPDGTFGGGIGYLTNSSFYRVGSMAVQENGYITIVGRGQFGGFIVSRYTADGIADGTFGTNGSATFRGNDGELFEACGVSIDADGKIVVVGYGDSDASQYTNHDFAVMRLSANGILDQSFAGKGYALYPRGSFIPDLTGNGGAPDYARAVAIQDDGKIVVAGQYDKRFSSSQTPRYDACILRVNANGSLDADFGTRGRITFDIAGDAKATDDIDNLLILEDGTIAVSTPHSVAFISNTGQAVSRYGSAGHLLAIGGDNTSLALDPEKRLLVASSGSLKRFNPDDGADDAFAGTGTATTLVSMPSTTRYGQRVTVQPDGRIVIGGDRLQRFTVLGGRDVTFGEVLGRLGGQSSYVEGGNPVPVDSDIGVADPDLSGLNGGLGDLSGSVLNLARTQTPSASDIFGIASGPLVANGPTASFGLSPTGRLSAGGLFFGSFSQAAGRLTIHFDGDGTGGTTIPTTALVNDVLQRITYRNTSVVPPPSVELTWTFSDGNTGSQGGGGALTATGTSIINITPTNSAPLSVSFANATTTLTDNTSTAARIKVADIIVEDDGMGTNALSIASEFDGGSFEIIDQALYLKAGVTLNRVLKPAYSVRVEVMDASVPFSTVAATFTLNIVRSAPTRPAAIGALMATPGNQRVTLSWSPPADDGGTPIVNYEIMVAEHTAGVWSSYRPVSRPASTATSADVTGLANGKPHIFVVRAVNSAGASPWVTLSRVVTPMGSRPGTVSALTAVAGSQRVTLSWTAPASDGGTPITNYEIMVAEHTAGVWSSYRPVSRPASTATSADVTGLANGKPHIFVVRAVNSAGASPWVTLSKVVTPMGSRPGAVSALTASAGNQRVTLSWTAPASDGGSPITNYEIMVAEQTGGVWSSYRPVSRPASTATSADVTGLSNGKPHIFVVRAVNSAGASPWVTLSRVATPMGTIPGAVSALRATVGRQQVTLNWAAPTDDGGSPVTNYEIMVAEHTGGAWSPYRPVSRPTSIATSAVVSGLTSGKIHIFVVRAVNARGAGRWQTLTPTVTPLA